MYTLEVVSTYVHTAVRTAVCVPRLQILRDEAFIHVDLFEALG